MKALPWGLMLRVAVFWLAGLLAFVGAALAAKRWLYAPVFALDCGVLEWCHAQVSPRWLAAARVFTVLGTAPGYVPLAGIAFVLLVRRAEQAWNLTALLAGSALYYVVLNRVIFSRERPRLFGNEPTFEGSSLPSGHALTTLVLAVAVCVGLAHIRPKLLPLVVPLALLFVLVIGATRLYLQAHYPSDVLAGWVLGAVWCTGYYAIRQKYASR
jgi:undecaprenyl-diphosphatase